MRFLFILARGLDERPVSSHRVRKSIGCEATFSDNVLDKKEVWNKLQSLAERLEQTLNNKQQRARTITLKVKYSDFQLITRSNTADRMFETKLQILELLPSLLRKTEVGERPIRLIGLSVSKLQSSVLEPGASSNVRAQANNNPQLGLF